MPEVLPGNGITSTLVNAIDDTDTTLQIQADDVAAFPSSGTYRINLHSDAAAGPWEIATVTGGQGTATLTITRASEAFRGIQAANGWASGTNIVPVLTRGALAAGAAVPDPLTLETLQVTGELQLHDPGVNEGGDLLIAARDTTGRGFQPTFGTGDMVFYSGQTEDNPTVSAPGIWIVGGSDPSSTANLIMTSFATGHDNEVTLEGTPADAAASFAFLQQPDGSGHRIATLGINAYDAVSFVTLLLTNGRMGINVDPPQSMLHVGGDTRIDGNVGFYGTAPAARPDITGSRTDGTALASLLTALAGLGLIVDSSMP